MWNSSIWPIDRALSGSEWTWEWLKWRGALNSPKYQHYWSLTIRLFNVISRTLIGRVLPLFKVAQSAGGCRIHRPHVCWEVRPPSTSVLDMTKQCADEVPVMLEHWGMPRTPSLPSLPGPFWPGMVASDKFRL